MTFDPTATARAEAEEARALEAWERYRMLLAMIEYNQAREALRARQMNCVRPRFEEKENGKS